MPLVHKLSYRHGSEKREREMSCSPELLEGGGASSSLSSHWSIAEPPPSHKHNNMLIHYHKLYITGSLSSQIFRNLVGASTGPDQPRMFPTAPEPHSNPVCWPLNNTYPSWEGYAVALPEGSSVFPQWRCLAWLASSANGYTKLYIAVTEMAPLSTLLHFITQVNKAWTWIISLHHVFIFYEFILL